MNNLKFASWVSGRYLDWINNNLKTSYDCLEDELKPHFDEIYFVPIQFFSREDSKNKLKTLITINEHRIEHELTVKNDRYSHVKSDLDVLSELIFIAHWDGYQHGTTTKKDFYSSIANFKKATDKLFNTIDSRYKSFSWDLVDGLDKQFFNLPSPETIENKSLRATVEILNNFFLKSPHQVLIEFADHIESIGTADPHYSVNNREATESQLKIRKMLFCIASLIGIEATKRLKGIGPLITHLIVIALPDQENLCVRDVNRQIKNAINLCETHGIPIIGV